MDHQAELAEELQLGPLRFRLVSHFGQYNQEFLPVLPTEEGERDALLADAEPRRSFSTKCSPWDCLIYDSYFLFRRGAYWCLVSASPEQPVCHIPYGLTLEEVFAYPLGQLVSSTLLATRRQGLVMHAALVTAGERAYLLSGVSGSGKSTLASLLLKHSALQPLADDRCVVHTPGGGGEWIVSSTPWAGTAGLARAGGGSFCGVYFLGQADKNTSARMPPEMAAPELFRCCFPTFWHHPGMEFALDLCIRIAREVPCRMLGFRPDDSAAAFMEREIGV